MKENFRTQHTRRDMYFKVYNIFPFVSQDFFLDPGKGWMYQNCYASFVQMIQFLYVFHTQAHTRTAHSFFMFIPSLFEWWLEESSPFQID